MKEELHTKIFGIICTLLVLIGSVPGPFDWSNRIEPWIFNLPFSIFWLLFLNFCICIVFVIWYFTDMKKGKLDLDIDKEQQ